jgi:hypothetical protein
MFESGTGANVESIRQGMERFDPASLGRHRSVFGALFRSREALRPVA